MNRAWQGILLSVVILAALAGGFWMGHRSTATSAPPDAATKPTDATQPASDSSADSAPDAPVPVRTVPIRSASLQQQIVAYGSIGADPGAVAVISVPFESSIATIAVTAGQPVKAGALLAQINPSAHTQLDVRQARAALESAKKDFAQTQQRFSEHLGTNADLLTSQQNLDVAHLKLDSLLNAGAGDQPRMVTAPMAGVVSKIDVQPGQIVADGAPMFEVAPTNHIVARLGVEPREAANLQLGDVALLHPAIADATESITGKVLLIPQRINGDSHLVDVLVQLPEGAALPLDSFVRAELSGATSVGLVVPRQALVPQKDGYCVFIVKDDKAVRHDVRLGVSRDALIQISGEGIAAGDAIVVGGNLELDDGVAVIATPQEPATDSTTAPAATEGGQ